MKGLLLFALVGISGYYAYHYWSAKPEPVPAPIAPPVAAAAVTAKPEPVSFAVKSRVRSLLAEWKRRSLGGKSSELGSAKIDAASELTEIRKLLFRDGIHSETAVADTVSRALRELGVAETEVKEVTGGILRLR
jgi:hypothetical protein